MQTIQGIEDIYFEQTKEYFKEVLSSYFNNNYRSAIVLLYSIVVSDLCLKLNELANSYDDNQAKNILNDVIQSQTSDNKSKWEKDLIEKVYSSGFINSKLKSDIDHLYSDRCFSAHPSMDNDYKLISPSKEMTVAHIKNMLNELFIEPPTFNKDMVGRITDELEQRKSSYDDKQLEQYLISAFFSRITEIARVSLFKSMWLFCFNKPHDIKCKENSNINRKALLTLVNYDSSLLENAKKHSFLFHVSSEEWCLTSLCKFLPFSKGFDFLDNNDRTLIKNYVSKNKTLKYLSWYIFDTFDEYKSSIVKLTKRNGSLSMDYDDYIALKAKFENEGCLSDFLDICINIFAGVDDFYYVDDFYNRYIRSNIDKFNFDQLNAVLKAINDNRTIRDSYFFEQNDFFKLYKEKTGKNPDFKIYNRLKKSPEYMESEDSESE